MECLIVPTIESGHLEALDGGQEGSEEAVLIGRGEARGLCVDTSIWDIGCADGATVIDEHQTDPQVAA